MAKADVQLTISGGEMTSANILRFEPGSALQARAQFTAQEPVKYRSIRVTVEWHTEGYGNRDHGEGGVTILAQAGVLQPGAPLYQQVNFTLPQEPWSYAGNLINIIWEAKATIDIALGKDFEAVQPFILAPREARRPDELAGA